MDKQRCEAMPTEPTMCDYIISDGICEPAMRPKLGVGIAAVVAGLAIPICAVMGPWPAWAAIALLLVLIMRYRWIARANNLMAHEASDRAELSRVSAAYDRLCGESVAEEPAAAEIVQGLTRVASHVEIGVERSDYAKCLADAWSVSADWLSRNRNSAFAFFADRAFSDYRRALDLWASVDQKNARPFIGGGFGVEGALEGMAMASALNVIASSGPKAAVKKTWSEIHSLWADAAGKVSILRSRVF